MSSSTITDVDVVRGGFEAFGRGDLEGFIEVFHPDATWKVRRPRGSSQATDASAC